MAVERSSAAATLKYSQAASTSEVLRPRPAAARVDAAADRARPRDDDDARLALGRAVERDVGVGHDLHGLDAQLRDGRAHALADVRAPDPGQPHLGRDDLDPPHARLRARAVYGVADGAHG